MISINVKGFVFSVALTMIVGLVLPLFLDYLKLKKEKKSKL